MKFDEMKVNELTDIVAVVGITIALFLSIALEQKDLGLMLGGALGGVIGMSTKNFR